MSASEIANSIDKQIAELKFAYDTELSALRNEVLQAKAEAAAAQAVALREGNKATSAVQMAATLIAHFGAVSKLFEDARTVATKAQALFGDIESKAAKVEQAIAPAAPPVTPQTIAAVEGALHSSPHLIDQLEAQLSGHTVGQQ